MEIEPCNKMINAEITYPDRAVKRIKTLNVRADSAVAVATDKAKVVTVVVRVNSSKVAVKIIKVITTSNNASRSC